MVQVEMSRTVETSHVLRPLRLTQANMVMDSSHEGSGRLALSQYVSL